MRAKRIAGIAGLLIAVLIVALYVIVTTYDFNRLKPKISEAVFQATGRQLTLKGDFQVGFGLSPSLSVEGVSLQNASFGSRPEMARMRALEVRMALLSLLRGKIQFTRLVLVEPDILIETDPSGRSNLEFKPREKPEPGEKKPDEGEDLPPLIFDEVRIEKGVLTYRDGKKEKTYALGLDRLAAALPGGEKPVEVDAQGTFNGRPFELKGTTGPLKDLLEAGRPWPVKMAAKMAGASLSLEGTLKEPLKGKGLDLRVRAEGPSVRGVAEFAGLTGIAEAGSFEVSARATDPPGRIVLTEIKARVGESDLGGGAEADLSGARFRVSADLASARLDLRPFFPKKEGQAPAPAGGGRKEKVFPADPLPLEGLKALDADLKIRAGQVLLSPLALADLQARVALENGDLQVKPLNFRVAGGAVSGLFGLRTRESLPAFSGGFKIAGLEAGSLLKELGIRQILEGKVDGEIDLAGQGRSLAEWMGGLGGRTFLSLGKGRLENKYLNLIGADLAQSLLRVINPFQKEEEYTPLTCLVNGFDIKNGLARCQALVLDTGRMVVLGEGEINLKAETLNLAIRPTPKEGVGAGDLGKVGLSLGELAKPFRLGGTLAKPALALDPQGALTVAGKAAGGIALAGPKGIVAALASPSPQDPNPCLTALEKVKKGKGSAAAEKPEKREKAPGKTGEIEEAGKRLFDLFK